MLPRGSHLTYAPRQDRAIDLAPDLVHLRLSGQVCSRAVQRVNRALPGAAPDGAWTTHPIIDRLRHDLDTAARCDRLEPIVRWTLSTSSWTFGSPRDTPAPVDWRRGEVVAGPCRARWPRRALAGRPRRSPISAPSPTRAPRRVIALGASTGSRRVAPTRPGR